MPTFAKANILLESVASAGMFTMSILQDISLRCVHFSSSTIFGHFVPCHMTLSNLSACFQSEQCHSATMSSVKLLSKIQHGIAWSHGSFSSRGLFDFYCLPVSWQILYPEGGFQS